MPLPSLHKKDRTTLLQLARRVLEEALKSQKSARHPEWLNPILQSFKVSDNSPRAVFLTLKKERNLRGCIGSTHASSPLLEAVALTTLKSAFEDPRFPPLSEQELPQIEIEISLLSPMEKIDSHEKIIPFQHGVFIQRGFRSGLFLPQVWKEIPHKEDFLNELCLGKAGLPAEAWKEPQTEIFIFTVEHFSESEYP